jgi:hypothetical protein
MDTGAATLPCSRHSVESRAALAPITRSGANTVRKACTFDTASGGRCRDWNQSIIGRRPAPFSAGPAKTSLRIADQSGAELYSVFRWIFQHVIDHQNFFGALMHFHFQPQLLLDRIQEGNRSRWVRCLRGGPITWRWASPAHQIPQA